MVQSVHILAHPHCHWQSNGLSSCARGGSSRQPPHMPCTLWCPRWIQGRLAVRLTTHRGWLHHWYHLWQLWNRDCIFNDWSTTATLLISTYCTGSETYESGNLVLQSPDIRDLSQHNSPHVALTSWCPCWHWMHAVGSAGQLKQFAIVHRSMFYCLSHGSPALTGGPLTRSRDQIHEPHPQPA